ncbi:hypothetical protein [Cellvibrio sp. OA-2007]|uniref:hypothetical protein n=1 Tax=Cellvibrio sp. OA-2007 TaxID=529823 RepID=UPI00187C3CB9|nr:hypothetical protein [Cellvibrio sp. OA-2007]
MRIIRGSWPVTPAKVVDRCVAGILRWFVGAGHEFRGVHGEIPWLFVIKASSN